MSSDDYAPLRIHNEYFVAKIKALLIEFEPDDRLDELIEDLLEFKESGLYDVLFNLGNSDDMYKSLKLGKKLEKELIFDVNLIARANQNLNTPRIYPFFKKNLINFPDFFFLYKFMELRYFLSLMRKLTEEDLKKLYFSGIDEHIILNLDRFDDVENFEENHIGAEFFITLKNLEWDSKESKNFFFKLNSARTDLFYNSGSFSDDEVFSSRDSATGHSPYTPSRMIPTFPPLNKKDFWNYATRGGSRSVYPINPLNLVFDPYDNPYLNFPATENAFLLFLAGCNVVNNGRDKINSIDVILAYKTYYKLLSTDISEILDDLWDKKDIEEEYLVCDTCESYYKLQEGESPEDFSDECECGGKLVYSDFKTI